MRERVDLSKKDGAEEDKQAMHTSPVTTPYSLMYGHVDTPEDIFRRAERNRTRLEAAAATAGDIAIEGFQTS